MDWLAKRAHKDAFRQNTRDHAHVNLMKKEAAHERRIAKKEKDHVDHAEAIKNIREKRVKEQNEDDTIPRSLLNPSRKTQDEAV